MKDGRFQKITAIDWCPSALRLAIATVDRHIILFDEHGAQKDKFSTKPGNRKSPRNYIVRGLAFSPDSTKLAVAQSDNIVFVYKLGSNWGDKKTICNKFTQTSSVTCLCWPSDRNELVFGLADGKLRIGICRNNKSATLYHTDTCVVSTASCPDGQSFVSGHLDGNIYRYSFPNQDAPQQGMLTHVDFVPYCLGWGEHIVAAGNTSCVKFFDTQGGEVQTFDYSGDDAVKEFSSLAFNPSGQTVVLGNFSRFYIYAFDAASAKWQQTGVTVVENLYTVTALAWKSDGSRLATGSLCGAVDIYDACIRRSIYRGKYEFTYTSPSSVIVKKLQDGRRMSLSSRFRCEIKKVNIYRDRFLVAHTPDTLIMADWPPGMVETEPKISEIPWNGSGKEMFFFDNENACMVFNRGELSLIEYGENDVLGSLRTEYMTPHLISLRLGEARNSAEQAVKKIAYLLDNQAVSVLDLASNMAEATYSHDCKIDWLELNQRATKLLFRDKRRVLHLYDLATQNRITMLNFCNYVQWVPDSDVVVAQNRRQLCIWYSVDNTSDVKTYDIKGDVEEIERVAGRTEVIVDEGINTATYKLDEQLIAFGTAIDAKDWKRGADILQEQGTTSGSDAMWRQLSEMALQDRDLLVAERCFAALGDVARTHFLRQLNTLVKDHGDVEHFKIRANLFILSKQFKRAEMVLLQNGQVEEAIKMYRQLHKWDEALMVA
jgi:intraflagellar transport protein 172